MPSLRVFQQPPLSKCLEAIVGIKEKNSDITVLPNLETGTVAPPPIRHEEKNYYPHLSHCPGRDSCPSFHISSDIAHVGWDVAMLCANKRVAAAYIDFLNYWTAGKIS